MASFDRNIGPLIEKEGGYKLTNHPRDRGGRTFAGISHRANPDWEGWAMIENGESPSAIEEATHRRYRAKYWNPIWGDHIIDENLAECMFSCAVLEGVGSCVGMLQMVTGQTVDRAMGPKTLAAINGMDVKTLRMAFAMMRIDRFRTICNNDPKQDVFLRGWINRVFGELEGQVSS